ncbi:hypothetical protein Tco_0444460 [Tanacetum coccineum]
MANTIFYHLACTAFPSSNLHLLCLLCFELVFVITKPVPVSQAELPISLDNVHNIGWKALNDGDDVIGKLSLDSRCMKHLANVWELRFGLSGLSVLGQVMMLDIFGLCLMRLYVLKAITAIEKLRKGKKVWDDIQVVLGFWGGKDGFLGIIQLEVLAVLVPQVVFSSLGLPLTLSFPFRAWISHTKAVEAYIKNSTNLTELLTLVNNFDFPGLKTTVDSLQAAMTRIENTQTNIQSDIASLKKDTSEIKDMMTEILCAFKGQPFSTPSSSESEHETRDTGPIPINVARPTIKPTLKAETKIIRSLSRPRLTDPIVEVQIPEPKTLFLTLKPDRGKGIARDTDESLPKLIKASNKVYQDPNAPIVIPYKINGVLHHLTNEHIQAHKVKESQHGSHWILIDLRSGYHQKDRKPSQNDKTEHGMEKTVQNQGQSPKMPKSESIQKNQQSNRSRN